MAISFTPDPTDLPATLPIFPLAGALLLPRGRLPLNIFEPRYLAMVEDALSAGRLIGMVQPVDDGKDVYSVGCAGRIVSLNETDDGRFLLTLKGVCRFRLGEELQTTRGYRRVQPMWQDYIDDVSDAEETMADDARHKLIDAVKPYFKSQSIVANWDTIEEASIERLINSLAAVCPFSPSEKQALLEAQTLNARYELLLALMGMAGHSADMELIRH